jgi:hypothetical protein
LRQHSFQHLVAFARRLDVGEEGANWREVIRIVLHIDPEREPDGLQHAFGSHLALARRMTESDIDICSGTMTAAGASAVATRPDTGARGP